MTLLQRAKAPTPKVFKLLRAVGLCVAGIGSAIVASPIALPLAVATLGSYMIVAGGVAGAVSQLTVLEDEN